MSSPSQAIQLQNEGNKFVKENKFEQAIDCYSKAILIESTNYIFFANRALAYIKINEFDKALVDCKLSINLCKTYPNCKSYHRMCIALCGLHKYEKAIRHFEIAQQKYLKFYFVKNQQIETGLQSAIKALNDSVVAPFIRLKTPLIQIPEFYYPDPLHYKQCLIIAPPNTSANNQIYKYDIINDTFDILCQYPKGATVEDHSICLDERNANSLCILSMLEIMLFNITDKKWQKIHRFNQLKEDLAFVPNKPLKYSESWCKTRICLFDHDANKLRRIKLLYKYLKDEIIYIPFVKKLFMFSEDKSGINQMDIDQKVDRIKVKSIESIKVGDHIDYKSNSWNRETYYWSEKIIQYVNYETNEIRFYCDDYSKPKFEADSDRFWLYQYIEQPYKSKLPFKHHCFRSILAFDVIVFFFCYDSKDIWCLNICNDEWIKCNVKFPTFHGNYSKYCKITKTDDNVVHFMYLSCGDEYYDNYHFKVSLYDVMPHKLKIFEKGIYNLLIYAYFGNDCFPQDVVFLICQYCYNL